ncbi:type II secretion system protein GspE [Enterobacter roggenkampii]|uniref:type II secretion system protein GspE n=1 Tax=Enterobacter roggenkampii TaxID=1812935 RepID=UPI001C7038E7|nr:type II secretion system protein GspE [Enterobacter roggenkampii]MBW9416719.1 type II secretion system protein GspE [Enterobacter roggenkampii]MCK6651546.1 type II secretion system protein GspE [Enterobacter roggenkampii]MCM6992125.1 type II secretion system protein GspE [Enterobacter roggenkampii]MCM7076153.1 type II secretion system protein GspE [Enterobacter roggenkampii]HCT2634004.1 type II secretion system protein GspE [Enterobacter roggenkampii]
MNTDQLVALCLRHHALLLSSDSERINIAVVGKPAPELMEALRFATQKRIDIECWSAERMEKHRQLTSQSHLPGVSQTHSTVDVLNHTLQQAINQRASDIHIEPMEHTCQIRLRIDGVLCPQPPLAAELANLLSARLKVLGNLDIAERRLPQDGQFTIELANEPVSFRIATLPCSGGEKIVLRLLHQVPQALEPKALGMDAEQLACFNAVLHQPQGLILVTGPTGSGKTVTLYSALQSRNTPDVNICSVEDPIEIPLAGLNQTQINPRAGLTFQNVLRALLRQDPDIIMVGEIRDGETAGIAINAAQTGHLVLSTLHTNSTTETLIRLEQMGVARWMISSALTMVIAQRLVRRLCPHCRRETRDQAQLPRSVWPRPLPRWQPTGCDRCYHGFYGRVAIFEVLAIDNALRQAIASGAGTDVIEASARQAGMVSLFEHGCRAVEQGLTTIEELLRVLGMPNGG